MIPHAPNYYVAGMYSETTDEWMGKFHLKAKELLEFAEVDAQTVAEYEACMCMLSSQQMYEYWWERVKNNY